MKTKTLGYFVTFLVLVNIITIAFSVNSKNLFGAMFYVGAMMFFIYAFRKELEAVWFPVDNKMKDAGHITVAITKTGEDKKHDVGGRLEFPKDMVEIMPTEFLIKQIGALFKEVKDKDSS